MNEIQNHIERMKGIEETIIKFINKEKNVEEIYQNLIQQIEDSYILIDKHYLKAFLYLLSNILSNHCRTPNFFSKIEMIFLSIKEETQEHFSSYELYNIYKKCPRFLLFLFNKQIIDDNIDDLYNFIPQKVLKYLFPGKIQKIQINNKILREFKEKQIIGENDDYLSQIIREDLIEDFIIYVNKNDYSLRSIIVESLFETNCFLIKQKQTTLIEYAAFFGSTQIFTYLYKNGVELTPSLWLYAIHSDNPEMIYLLEFNRVQPPNNSYEKCLKESIKCHHNDIVKYIRDNFMRNDIENIDKIDFHTKFKENIFSYSFHYHNFNYFPQETENEIIFYYACRYDYFKIVEHFLMRTKIDINEKIITNNRFFFLIQFQSLVLNDILNN